MAERRSIAESLARIAECLEGAAQGDARVRDALLDVHRWLGELLGSEPARGGLEQAPARRREPVVLDLVRARAVLKSEAFGALRKGELAGGLVDSFTARAGELPGCYLFALEPRFTAAGPEVLEAVERAYANAALAVEVARRYEDTAETSDVPPADLLYTLAEAQSALRAALIALDVREDVDQLTLFRWVRDQAFEHRVYIPRYFRADDLADPSRFDDLQERLDALGERLDRVGQDRRERRRLLGKLGFQAAELAQADFAPGAQAWQNVLRTVEEWVAGGRSPSARDLCELLAPAVERWPAELVPGPGGEAVLHAVDALLAVHQQPHGQPAASTPPTPAIQHAATRLTGKRAVLFGGELRRLDRARLERDLKLSELRWIVSHAEPSEATLVAAARATDVDLILFAERFARRGSEGLERAAHAFSKPFVRITGGYDPAEVALAIQASNALK